MTTSTSHLQPHPAESGSRPPSNQGDLVRQIGTASVAAMELGDLPASCVETEGDQHSASLAQTRTEQVPEA